MTSKKEVQLKILYVYTHIKDLIDLGCRAQEHFKTIEEIRYNFKFATQDEYEIYSKILDKLYYIVNQPEDEKFYFQSKVADVQGAFKVHAGFGKFYRENPPAIAIPSNWLDTYKEREGILAELINPFSGPCPF